MVTDLPHGLYRHLVYYHFRVIGAFVGSRRQLRKRTGMEYGRQDALGRNMKVSSSFGSKLNLNFVYLY